MSGSLRVGIIGGAGWLGSAIGSSLIRASVVDPACLSLSYRSRQPQSFPQSFWTRDNQELVDRSDVVILSVRPQDWPAVAIDLGGKLLISVMAGSRIEALSARHATPRVVRALPNAAAEVSHSYTPWVASDAVGEEDRAVVRTIFEACGVEDEVASEGEIDYFTGLTGSGPAFPALLAAAMAAHAGKSGIAADVACRAVLTSLIGTGRLLERHAQCPQDIVAAFLDYRGTTAAAIEAMRAGGFDKAVSMGLDAAFSKSVSMGGAS